MFTIQGQDLSISITPEIESFRLTTRYQGLKYGLIRSTLSVSDLVDFEAAVKKIVASRGPVT